MYLAKKWRCTLGFVRCDSQKEECKYILSKYSEFFLNSLLNIVLYVFHFFLKRQKSQFASQADLKITILLSLSPAVLRWHGCRAWLLIFFSDEISDSCKTDVANPPSQRVYDGPEAWERTQNSAPKTSREINIYLPLHGKFSKTSGLLPFVWQYHKGWGLVPRHSGLADVGG